MELKIRKAILKDSDKILILLNSDKNLTGDEGVYYKPKYIKDYILGKPFITFVCEINNKIVGLVIAHVSNIAKYAELNMIVVDKKYRKKGIASKLMSFLEDYLVKKKYELIFLYTEEDNEVMKMLAEKEDYKKGKKFYFYSKLLK